MITIPNYQILEQIGDSAKSGVYRAIRNEDQQHVILKILKKDSPTAAELAHYRHEYDILCQLNIDGVIKAYGLEKYKNGLMMCLEDFGGKSLRHWLQTCMFSLEELLQLAIGITNILEQIHEQHIIHKNISPAHIIYNPVTRQLKIIGFGISTQFSWEMPSFKHPNALEGTQDTLYYISPEQTGRMNRILDYRTDFYSLGATFYQLFTCLLPFKTTDAMELIYRHIAEQPLQPLEINPLLPLMVSNIILKLLEKWAEKRYQTAWGLRVDLETCFKHLTTTLLIDNFPLAHHDIPSQLQIPQQLYGRKHEIDTLLNAFEQVSQGQTQLMLVTGYSGIGKSVLVKEIYQSLTAKQGYFMTGKFDPLPRHIPYSAITLAFRELVQQQLLTSNESQLAHWREELLTALGSNGQIIIDVIPEVEQLIGKQPTVLQLEPTESQNRFNLVFQKFIRVFCQPQHPLVMFLDDLQWADSATLKLLELVMTDKETGFLFLIGAYRDNEVSPTHPLMITLDKLRKESSTINQLQITPLRFEAVNQLIADSLRTEWSAIQPLTAWMMDKTGGNPFFIKLLLEMLSEESLFTFDSKTLSWQWDIVQIQAMNITDNVVKLVIGKLKQLPHASRHVLRLAACIGHGFDLNILSVISENTPSDTFEYLMPILTEGLVLPTSPLEITEGDVLNAPLSILHFRFLHDCVQQAAYALISDREKQLVHLQIGRLLLKKIPTEALANYLFEIVEQLNHGRNLLYVNGPNPYVLREELICGLKNRTTELNDSMEQEEDSKTCVKSKCTCQETLGQFSDMFRNMVHTGQKLVDRASNKKYLDTTRQNQWLLNNVFDLYGNYLYCFSCIKELLGVSGKRLHRLREIKRQQAKAPKIQTRSDQVPREQISHIIPPVSESNVLTWWMSLENSSIVELRFFPKVHSGKSNYSREELLPYFLDFIDKNSQANGRRIGSHGPLFFLNSKFDRINEPYASEKNKPEQWKRRSLVYEFNRSLSQGLRISNGTAKTWLKTYRPKHAISPKKTDYCEMCVECQEQKRRYETISMRLQQNGRADEDEIRENQALAESYGLLLEEHKMDSGSELQHYREQIQKCQTSYQQLFKSRSKTKSEKLKLQELKEQLIFTFSLDYQQSMLIPHWGFSPQPSETYYLRKLSHNVFGLVDHTQARNTIYVLDERVGGAKNGDITISLVDHYIQRLPSWVRHLCFFMDNGATNKNQFMIQWAMELVEKSDYESIRMCFFVPGHAKSDVDRLFARISHAFKNNDVFVTEHLITLIQQTLNSSDKCVHINNRDIVNWKGLLEKKYMALKEIKSYRDFLIRRNEKGKVVVNCKPCCYKGEYVCQELKKEVGNLELWAEIKNFTYETKGMSKDLSPEKVADLVKMYNKFIDPILRPKWLPTSQPVEIPPVTISSPSSELARQHQEALRRKNKKTNSIN